MRPKSAPGCAAMPPGRHRARRGREWQRAARASHVPVEGLGLGRSDGRESDDRAPYAPAAQSRRRLTSRRNPAPPSALDSVTALADTQSEHREVRSMDERSARGFRRIPLSPEELRLIDAWWRAANYLSVGQIYLLDNPLLKEPLTLRAHQAAPARPLGNDAGAKLRLCPSQSRHQGARSRHDLHRGPRPWRARPRRQHLARRHL